MSLAIVHSKTLIGINSLKITVETHISNGLPAFSIVGMPQTAVKESKDRVRSAILNSHFEFPAKRITVNLAPAALPKNGGGFDLPIAISILAASEQIPKTLLADYELIGELALSGEIRAITGALPIALDSKLNANNLILPQDNHHEASLVDSTHIFTAKHLLDVCAHLSQKQHLSTAGGADFSAEVSYPFDFDEIKGQHQAKRALEITAAGQHSLLMVGPPGSGKTMLAKRLITLLPPLSIEKALSSAALYSINGQELDLTTWNQRKFRAPHHSASAVALVGGGNPPKPGEISLAHHGILFLDELPEFSRYVLNNLREPLESGKISIARAGFNASFPANFQFVAAMNPCPCGHFANPEQACRCSPNQIKHYLSRLSGPLLDRIDIHLEVPTIKNFNKEETSQERSKEVRSRAIKAQEVQLKRQGKTNNLLSVKEIEIFCQLDSSTQKLLEHAMQKLTLSARSYHRILRVSRTIADLAEEKSINKNHLAEALSYRDLHYFNL